MFEEDLFNSLKSRVIWSVARLMFMQCGLKPSLGWDATISIFKTDEVKQLELQKSFTHLKRLYIENLQIGNKAVRFFKIEKEIKLKLLKTLQELQVENSFYHSKYPYILSVEELSKVNTQTTLVDIIDTDENITLVFCTKRLFKIKENIKADLNENFNNQESNQKTQEIISKYDEIYGIKTEEKQLFDVVVLWKEKDLLEVRVDIPDKAISHYIFQAFFETIALFNVLCKDTRYKIETEKRINLFSLLKDYYNFDGARVCEIGFSTNEGSQKGSIKHEKMRNRKFDDLKRDLYHSAGVQAVDHINLFLIAVTLDIPLTSEVISNPEIFLPGKSTLLSSPTPFLGEIYIKKTIGFQDYETIFNDLINRLKL